MPAAAAAAACEASPWQRDEELQDFLMVHPDLLAAWAAGDAAPGAQPSDIAAPLWAALHVAVASFTRDFLAELDQREGKTGGGGNRAH